MAGWLQSLLAVGLFSAGGFALRLLSLLGPPPFALAISVAVGVGAFIGAAVLLGFGLAIILVGTMIW